MVINRQSFDGTYYNMAMYAQRRNDKPILLFIAGMMIFFCLLATEHTTMRPYWFQFARLNSVIYSRPCFDFFWVILFISSYCPFAFVGSLPLEECFPVVDVLAFSARRIQSIFFMLVFIKFRRLFCVLAFRTFLCYGWFRHGFFLIKKLCSEPFRPQYLCGSSYYNDSVVGVK